MTIVIAVVFWEMVSSVIERYLARSEDGEVELSARAKTLLPLLRKALLVVVSTIVGFIVLSEIGVNIGPLLAGAGVIGLAVGFGSQTLVKDVITGVFILAEDQFAVGDVVRVNGKSGLVEEITIRTIRLRDLGGKSLQQHYRALPAAEGVRFECRRARRRRPPPRYPAPPSRRRRRAQANGVGGARGGADVQRDAVAAKRAYAAFRGDSARL